MSRFFRVIVSVLVIGFGGSFARATDLAVDVTNIRNDHGNVDVTLYDNPKYWLDDPHAVGNVTLPAQKGTVTAVFSHLKPGRYAVVTTHDENANGRMDFFLGLPIEGYAFSRNIRPLFSAPAFERAAFTVNTSDLRITIRMVYPFIGKVAGDRR